MDWSSEPSLDMGLSFDCCNFTSTVLVLHSASRTWSLGHSLYLLLKGYFRTSSQIFVTLETVILQLQLKSSNLCICIILELKCSSKTLCMKISTSCLACSLVGFMYLQATHMCCTCTCLMQRRISNDEWCDVS